MSEKENLRDVAHHPGCIFALATQERKRGQICGGDAGSVSCRGVCKLLKSLFELAARALASGAGFAVG
jgi:hypothetical protein